jgi:hypothetical protein
MNNRQLQNKTELSHIKNPEDLRQEIRRVKRRVKLHEAELKSGLAHLPREAAMHALGSAVPTFLRHSTTGKFLSFFQGLLAFTLSNALSRSGKNNAKNYFVNAAKQLGFLAATEVANIFLKKKKTAAK